MDPYVSPFARDQDLIRERLDFESQKNIARNYLPLKPAMTTRQKFTEDNLNALKLREEIETLKTSFAGKCNGGTVDAMTDGSQVTPQNAPPENSSRPAASLTDVLAAPVQISTFVLIVLIVIITAIVMTYYMQAAQWRTFATELALGNRLLSEQLRAATK